MSELWGMDEGEYSPLIASGVYVKGMEMPRGCFFCICNKHLDPDTDMCLLTQDAFDSTFQVVEHRRDNCPLVEIPPHGRLIDADAFAAEMKKRQDACAEWRDDIKNGGGYGTELYYRADSFLGAMCETKLTLDKMPTIIPADRGDENG